MTMKTKILILIFLGFCVMPQSGCKVRKSYKEQLKINASVTRDRDSMRVSMRDSMQALSLVRNTLAETVSRMDRMTSERRAENLNIEKRTITEPVKVPGKTFKTTVTGNFMLDTSAIKDGKLVYFDIDNEDVRVTAYTENGQMKALVETKEKTINVPVNEVRITQSTEATKSSSDKSQKEEKVITNSSLQEVNQVINSDSGSVNDAVKEDVNVKAATAGSASTGLALETIILIAAIVIISVALIWHFSVIGKVVAWAKRIINKIKSK